MTDKIRLIAPAGTDECNWAGNRYRVANDGSVEVDAGAVGPLLATGGFSLADPAQPVPATWLVPVRHLTDPNATCTVNGVTYAPDGDGVVQVPAFAVAGVACHGFRLLEPIRPQSSPPPRTEADE